MAGQIVAGELYGSITGQLFEIGRQLRQKNGYPYNAEHLKKWLQMAVEGKFQFYAPRFLKLPEVFDPNCFEGKMRIPRIYNPRPPANPAFGTCNDYTEEEVQNPRAASLKELDVANLVFEDTGPNVPTPYGFSNSEPPTHKDAFRRLKHKEHVIPLDARMCQALWQEKDHASLEWLRLTLGVKVLSFFGNLIDVWPGEGILVLIYHEGDDFYKGWLPSTQRLSQISYGKVPCVLTSNI